MGSCPGAAEHLRANCANRDTQAAGHGARATEEMAGGLRAWLDMYHARSDHERIRHFQVKTHPATVDESVRMIRQLADWA